jgi:hypothetical protein
MLAATLEKTWDVPKKQPDEIGVYRVFATMQNIEMYAKISIIFLRSELCVARFSERGAN